MAPRQKQPVLIGQLCCQLPDETGRQRHRPRFLIIVTGHENLNATLFLPLIQRPKLTWIPCSWPFLALYTLAAPLLVP